MRHRVAELLIVVLLGAQAGCAAIQHLDRLPEISAARPEVVDDTISIVAVRPPELRYADPTAEGLDEQIEESAHLIRVLRRTGLFEEVDFAAEVGCPIDIAVAAVPGEYPRLTGGPFWLNVVTLSAAVIDSREGVSFYPIDAPDTQIELRYETRMYVGIVPLLASPLLATGLLPGWEFLWAGPSTDESLRVLMQIERPRLAAHRNDATGKCESEAALEHGGE